MRTQKSPVATLIRNRFNNLTNQALRCGRFPVPVPVEAILALTLLVFGVLLVDDVKTSLAADDLAVRSALFDRCSYFHCLVVLL